MNFGGKKRKGTSYQKAKYNLHIKHSYYDFELDKRNFGVDKGTYKYYLYYPGDEYQVVGWIYFYIRNDEIENLRFFIYDKYLKDNIYAVKGLKQDIKLFIEIGIRGKFKYLKIYRDSFTRVYEDLIIGMGFYIKNPDLYIYDIFKD